MDQFRLNALNEAVASQYKNTCAITATVDGETVFSQYYNGFGENDCAHVFSVTKSITSILVGIALDKGLIDSVEQRILDFFDDYTPKRGEKTLQKITIKDILTMTCPYKYKYSPYTKFFSSPDWVKTSLDLAGGKGSIGEFRYAPIIGPDILSGIIKAVSKQNLADFAYDNLFKPLNIARKQSRTFESKEDQLQWYRQSKYPDEWIADEINTNTAAWGLMLKTQELCRIGNLYLNKGEYNKTRIVSQEWVEKSTSKQSYWPAQDLCYGYLWWVLNEDAHIYAAMGDGGNILYVNPEKKLVVASTASFKPTAKDRIGLIKEYIEPYM